MSTPSSSSICFAASGSWSGQASLASVAKGLLGEIGELGDEAEIVKVNVDEERTLGGMFQIMSIPALLIFKGGQKVDEIVGVKPKADIRRKVEAQL